jgi:hypothetical protein
VASGAKPAQDKAYREANAEALREKDRLKMRRRRKDPGFALKSRISVRLFHALRAAKIGSKRGRAWLSLVGYTIAELKRHIERQFIKGMTWANMGEWHIDHIIPVASFSYQSVDDPEFRICWGLTNLRPMWAEENRAKSDKVLTLL